MTIPSPAEIGTAWAALSPSLRDRIGLIALDMVFQGFLGGDAYRPEDRVLHSDDERGQAMDRESKRLIELYRAVEDALPDLFGPEGENPAWSHTAGGAHA